MVRIKGKGGAWGLEIAPRRRVDTVTAKGEKGGRENSGARRYFQVHF